MGRRKNLKKNPLSSRVRVKMCRQRKKLKEKRNVIVYDQINENELAHNAFVNNRIDENNDCDENKTTLKSKLRDWVNDYRISKRAVDSLLSILNSFGINSLPKNHRTLLHTPTDIKIDEVANGKFWYNGIEKCLASMFSTIDHDIAISLNFNVDGIPLYNSSKISFWPILASIFGM